MLAYAHAINEDFKKLLPTEREAFIQTHWDGEFGQGCNGTAVEYFDSKFTQS
jgi:hypothetical protein